MAAAAICVVLHDVAPDTRAACERVLDAVADVQQAPVTLLAVPRYHGAPRSPLFERWLHERSLCGDEVCLHGYTHLDEGIPHGWFDHLRRHHYTRGEGEFCALDEAEATFRLNAGRRWLEALGLPPRGFVAPAWLLSKGTWRALAGQPFDYTCTLGAIHLLHERRSLSCQALVYSTSSGWRRGMSLVWNRTLAALQARQPLMRLELHPHDADYREIRRSWQAILREHGNDRRALTIAEVAERLRRGPNRGAAASSA